MTTSPFLQAIAAEARRLEHGFLASRGHVADCLGLAPDQLDRDEGHELLLAFAAEHGLDVGFEEPDGVRFTREADPNRRESTIPPIYPADLKPPAA